MKILVITNLYPPHEIGGYEIRCRDVCERLRQHGHDIRILTSNHRVEGRPTTDDPGINRSLRIHGMYGNPWLPIHRLASLEWHNQQMLRRELKSNPPDLIHVWNMGGISKSLLLTIQQLAIPVVHDISDHWLARSLRADVWLAWWNTGDNQLARIAKTVLQACGLRGAISKRIPTAPWDTLRFPHIYFCSAYMRDTTTAQGWPVDHASVIHCGVDTAAFQVKSDHERFTKLLWVGRLATDKDPWTAVRALAATRNKDLHLDLYGHGSEEDVRLLRKEIEILGLNERVTMTSAPAPKMREIYAQYDALLFTSNWGEPFALTPLEAMASGLPVITSLDGGQRELAQHGHNCLVAEAGNPGEYGRQIDTLAESADLRKQIANHALDQVRRDFDINHIATQIEAFLQQAART